MQYFAGKKKRKNCFLRGRAIFENLSVGSKTKDISRKSRFLKSSSWLVAVAELPSSCCRGGLSIGVVKPVFILCHQF
jgi:hypothetical protein